MPFKIRTKLIVAFLGLTLVLLSVTGIVGYYNQMASREAFQEVEEISREVKITGDIQLIIERILMPANDYIITGNRKYIDDFKRDAKELETLLREAEAIIVKMEKVTPEFTAEEKKILSDINVAWLNIKDISNRIFAISNPVGNMEAARLMEEMDYKWGKPAADGIHKWHELDYREYEEAIESARTVWLRLWIIMGGSAVMLIFLGIAFAVFYSGLFVKPIKAIHNGADAIAAGNFKTRLDIKTGDEIEQLSNAMNEMAGKLDDFYGTLENQVEEKTRECRESEEKYRTMIESANDMIWMLDREGMFLFINNQAEKIGGYTVEEVIGKHYLTFVHPEDKAMREEYFKRTLSGESTQFTVRSFGKDGGERILILQVSSAPVYKEGKVVGTVNFGRDITEYKKAEEKLQESEERFRVLGMTAPNAIICLTAPDTVIFWNRRAAEIFGYSEEEVIGKPMHGLIVPEKYREKAGEGMKNFFKTGTGPVVGKKTELSALRRDGSEFPIELSLSSMNIGGEWQATGIVRDITERKAAEEKLKKNLDDLKRMNRMMVDREIRMIELKKENQRLRDEAGKKSS